MSLLDTGPDTLVFRPAIRTTDDSGNHVWRDWEKGDPEYTVKGVQVQYGETETRMVNGQAISNDVTAIFRKLPKDMGHEQVEYSVVVWDGRKWDVDGELVEYRRGRLTKHQQLSLKERR